MKSRIAIITILFVTSLFFGCEASLPPFAGLTGYAYKRAEYPTYYYNKVTISTDGKRYTNHGNAQTNNLPVVSTITSWTATTMTIYNADANMTATCTWTTDNNGLVIYID